MTDSNPYLAAPGFPPTQPLTSSMAPELRQLTPESVQDFHALEPFIPPQWEGRRILRP